MALIQIVENKKKSLGIYVHIPFCRSKCEYCDFYSVPGARSRDLMDRYLDAVILHIREAAQGAAGYEVDTVYFGGGTPSFFGAGGLAKIFAEIDRRFKNLLILPQFFIFNYIITQYLRHSTILHRTGKYKHFFVFHNPGNIIVF